MKGILIYGIVILLSLGIIFSAISNTGNDGDITNINNNDNVCVSLSESKCVQNSLCEAKYVNKIGIKGYRNVFIGCRDVNKNVIINTTNRENQAQNTTNDLSNSVDSCTKYNYNGLQYWCGDASDYENECKSAGSIIFESTCTIGDKTGNACITCQSDSSSDKCSGLSKKECNSNSSCEASYIITNGIKGSKKTFDSCKASSNSLIKNEKIYVLDYKNCRNNVTETNSCSKFDTSTQLFSCADSNNFEKICKNGGTLIPDVTCFTSSQSQGNCMACNDYPNNGAEKKIELKLPECN